MKRGFGKVSSCVFEMALFVWTGRGYLSNQSRCRGDDDTHERAHEQVNEIYRILKGCQNSYSYVVVVTVEASLL